MRLLSAIKFDIRFQLRHGFYYAYLLVSLIYILLIRLLPVSVRELATIFVVFTDPSVLGFFFIGGIILLEKGQNIFESLFVTPYRTWEYQISKLASLTLLAFSSSLVIVLATVGWRVNILLLTVGILLSSVLFTLFGMTLAFISKTVNDYIISSLVYMPVFFLPMLELFGIYKTPLFLLLPTKATLLLMQGAFSGISLLDFLYSISTLAVWIAIAWIWAQNWFHKYIILREGGVSK